MLRVQGHLGLLYPDETLKILPLDTASKFWDISECCHFYVQVHRMQQILEETLTKNMHLQQSLDQISQVGNFSVVYSVSVANLTANSNLELNRRIMVYQIYFIQCSGSDQLLLTQPVGMASKCTEDAENFYATLVVVFI